MRPALLLLLTACVCMPVAAQPVRNDELPLQSRTEDLPIRFESVTLEDGLSQSAVYSIAQDAKGFMWFGTQSGLNRYDGTRVEVFRPDPFDSTAILPRFIWDIEPDGEGGLWLGYSGGSVGHFDPATGRARNYVAVADDPTRLAAGGTVYDVFLDSGNVWVLAAEGPPAGIQKLDPETGKVTRYGAGTWKGGPESGPGNMVRGGDGLLYVFAAEGVYRFDAEAGSLTRITDISAQLPHPDPDDPDVLWAGSEKGVARITLSTGSVQTFDVTASDNDGVIEAIPDPTERGIVWASTLEGLARLDKTSGAFRQYRSNTGDPNSLLGNFAARVYGDRSGIIWVSVAGAGVSRFDPTAIGFGKETETRNRTDAMRGTGVWAINVTSNPVIWVTAVGSDTSDPSWFVNRIDRTTGSARSWRLNMTTSSSMLVEADGTAWIAARPAPWTVDIASGVHRYDETLGRFVPAYTVAGGALPSDDVRKLTRGRDGTLWIGTEAGLVAVGRDGRRRSWTTEGTDGLRDGRIRYIMEDSRGDVWVSSFRSLARLKGGAGPVEFIDSRSDAAILNDAYARYPTEDLEGHLWWLVSIPGGSSAVVRYDAESDRFTTYRHDPTDRTTWTGVSPTGAVVEEGHSERLWFTSLGGGLSRLDVAGGTFRHFGVADGLTNLDAYQPIFDNEGILWIPTNSGLFSFDTEKEVFQRYGLEYGLQSLEFNGSSVAKSASGELFFGGVRGFNAFFPSQLRANETPPEVAITDFLLFNEEVLPGPGSPLVRGIGDTEEVRLAHNQNAPSFRFAALHYKRPQANQVRYRLEPLQSEWIDARGVNEASYTNLEPGDYTFRVIAANSDGVWNEQGASIRLVVLPPWWRTWWAYVLYVLILGVGVFGVDRIQRARLAQKQEEERRVQEMAHAKEIETAYNQLQQTKEQLVQQEKLASLGSLTAGIAHEIKNPLNFVNNFAEVNAELADELEEAVASGNAEAARALLADLRGNAEQIAKHGKRADSIVRSMMQHARGGASDRETIEVNTFLEEYINLAWHGMRARDDGFKAEVVRAFAADAGVLEGMPQELGRVVLNLLGNAFDALKGVPSPRVIVSTRRTGSGVQITVADNGPGIPTEIREKIFEPFFTTKATGAGTGLGLSLSYDIVTKGHGGTMTVETGPEGGAQFVITLPPG